MIFNILSVTIAGVLGCLRRVSTCGGPSSAFTGLCCRPRPGTRRWAPEGSAADPAPEEGERALMSQ